MAMNVYTLFFIVQELCESRGGRPGLSVLTSLLVSVDVIIEPCFGIGHNLSLIGQLISEDIKHHFIIIRCSELSSCVKVEVDVLGSRP